MPLAIAPGPAEVKKGTETRTAGETASRDVWISLALFLGSAGYLLLFRNYTTLIDEGIILQGAERLLRGQVLYRNFFSFYTPGSYYLTALSFKLLGSSFLVARVRLLLYGGLFSVLTYLIARRTCSRWSSVLGAYLVLLCMPYCFYVQHNWDSTAFAFLAFYCLVRLLEAPSRTMAFALGMCTSLTFLFEQSKGAGLILGIVLTIIFTWVARRKAPSCEAGQARFLIAGFVVPVLFTFSYFAIHGALRAALNAWIWPIYHYSATNVVPYGYLTIPPANRALLASGSWFSRCLKYTVIAPCFIIPYIPVAGMAVSALHFIKALKRRGSDKSFYFAATGLTLFGVWLSMALTRADLAHCVFILPLFSVSLAWVLDGRAIPFRPLQVIKLGLAGFLLLTFTLFGIALLYNSLHAQSQETRRGPVKFPQRDEIVPYIEAHVARGQEIFVYPLHPLYYYLTGTVNPTRFEFLQPGLHTPDQEHETVSELEASHVKVVLLWPDFRTGMPTLFPGTPASVFAAADPVRDYVVSHYHVCTKLYSGRVEFWYMLRNGSPCIDTSP
jgi:4-amino-4-deoxy-L-arabinose transferase-like glycosyltransferase